MAGIKSPLNRQVHAGKPPAPENKTVAGYKWQRREKKPAGQPTGGLAILVS
jgi:hypothetical protein